MMAEQALPIVFILIQSLPSSFTETVIRTTNPVTVGEVNTTELNTVRKGNLYPISYDSRDDHKGQGSRHNSDAVAPSKSLSNNFVTDVTSVMEELISSKEIQRSDVSSHFYLEFKNCTNRIIKYHVIDSQSTIEWYFNAKELNTSWLPTTFCALDLSVPHGMVAVVETTTENIYCNAVSITLFDDSNVTLFTGCPYSLPVPFVTYSNRVTFRLAFIMEELERLSGFEMDAKITTLPETSRPQLEITFYSSTLGLNCLYYVAHLCSIINFPDTNKEI